MKLLILNHVTPGRLKLLFKIFQELSSSFEHSGSGMLWPESSHFPGNGWYHPIICQLRCTAHRPDLHSSLLIYSLVHPLDSNMSRRKKLRQLGSNSAIFKYLAEDINMYPYRSSSPSYKERKDKHCPSLGHWEGLWSPTLPDWWDKSIHLTISRDQLQHELRCTGIC